MSSGFRKDWKIYTTLYLDIQTLADSVGPDHMPQNAASEQGLHCLPLIQQFLGIPTYCKIGLVQIRKQVW